MSSKQQRNPHAHPADAEALESLEHMTAWARAAVTLPKAAPRKPFGGVIEGFALGATAFHPGPWSFPIDRVEPVQEAAPARPGLAKRAAQSLGATLSRAWGAHLRNLEIARATRILSQMDDRSLQDIGLCRTDIEHATRFGRDWERWR